VSVQQMLTGEGAPTVSSILERVRDEQNARDEAAERRNPGGHRIDEHLFPDLMPEPAVAARSAVQLELSNRIRHWRDRVTAQRRAADLENSYGSCPAVAPLWAGRASPSAPAAPVCDDSGERLRSLSRSAAPSRANSCCEWGNGHGGACKPWCRRMACDLGEGHLGSCKRATAHGYEALS